MSRTFITLLSLLLISLLIAFYTLSNNTDQSSEISKNIAISDTKLPSKKINQDLFLLKNTISEAVEGAAQDDIQRAVEKTINKTK